MSKPRKKHPKFQPDSGVSKTKPVAKAKGKKKLPKASPRELRNRGWMVAGFDTSMSALAGAAIGYDRTLKKFRGPYFIQARWQSDVHYYDRLKGAANSHLLVLDLMHMLRLQLNLDEVFIAQEEPWPMGMAGKGQSAFLKQQAEISGAFLGGLVRYGYKDVTQINSMRWRTMIAGDLGITTHHSKWRDAKLAARYNSTIQDSGKFRAKQWAMEVYPWRLKFRDGVTKEGQPVSDWPDIIKTGKGNTPRPDGSNARAIQPDDRYDALAIMWAHFIELRDTGVLPGLDKKSSL